MANVVIDDSSLHAIGDALRGKLGETHKGMVTEIIHHPEVSHDMVKIAKTSNATGFDTFSGAYASNLQDYQVITIPGATRIEVTFSYCTENINFDYLLMAQGDCSGGMPSDAEKFGGNVYLTTYTRSFSNDTVTFYFQSDNSRGDYLGYYAQVIGKDADGNIIQEVIPAWDEEVEVEADIPNTYKPRDMADAIASIKAGGGGGGNFANIGGLLTTTWEDSYYGYTYLPTDIESNKLYLHVTMHPVASSLSTRSYSGIDSSLVKSRKYPSYATITLVPTTAITGVTPSIYSSAGSSNTSHKCIHDVVAPVSNIDVNSIVMEDAVFMRNSTAGKATIELNPDYADYKKIIVIVKGAHEYTNPSNINDTKFYPIEEDCGFKRLSPTITCKSRHASYHYYLGVAILYQDAETHANTFTITVPQLNNNASSLYGQIIYYKTPEEDS